MNRTRWAWPVIVGVLTALARMSAADVAVTAAAPRVAAALTIYGNADLTLVREVRKVYLEAGRPTEVALEWPGAVVDPSSVRLSAPDGVTVSAPTQPPRRGDRMVFRLEARDAGERELQVSYFTSGLDWKPYYHLRLNEGTGELDLEGLANLRNRSGQVFDGAAVQLAVGDLQLVSNPAEAAWRSLPTHRDEKRDAPPAAGSGLSQQYLYDLGRVPRLAANDTQVLPFLPSVTIKTKVVHRLNQAKYGDGVHAVVVFENTPEAGLGRVPLAKAEALVSEVTAGGPLPRGRVTLPYTPPGERCELDLGLSRAVAAERRVMERRRLNFEFDRFGSVEGFDDRQDVEVEVTNFSGAPAAFEYTDTVPGVWDIVADQPVVEHGTNEAIFRLDLAAQAKQTLSYRLVLRQGKRVRLGPVRPK